MVSNLIIIKSLSSCILAQISSPSVSISIALQVHLETLQGLPSGSYPLGAGQILLRVEQGSYPPPEVVLLILFQPISYFLFL